MNYLGLVKERQSCFIFKQIGFMMIFVWLILYVSEMVFIMGFKNLHNIAQILVYLSN